MFELSKFLKLEAFQKTGYVAKKLRMTIADLAHILEVDEDLVGVATETGSIPDDLPNSDEAFERLYLLTMLFNYLLKMANYDSEVLLKLWKKKTLARYDSAIEKPPWYQKGLKDYLFDGRYMALESCVKWIKEY